MRHKRAKEIITAKSSAKQPKGIIRSHHAYIVIDYFELFSGTRYILLKNPWGYQGARLENKNGYLFLKLEDYLASMDYTYVNYDTHGWHQGYFMMWDDPAEQNGAAYMCGPECTWHRLIVRSEVKQPVYIGANTYSLYTYPDAIGECPVSPFDPQLKYADLDVVQTVAKENSKLNVITNSRDMKYNTFSFGAGWLEAIEFDAGEEIEVYVEFNWNR